VARYVGTHVALKDSHPCWGGSSMRLFSITSGPRDKVVETPKARGPVRRNRARANKARGGAEAALHGVKPRPAPAARMPPPSYAKEKLAGPRGAWIPEPPSSTMGKGAPGARGTTSAAALRRSAQKRMRTAQPRAKRLRRLERSSAVQVLTGPAKSKAGTIAKKARQGILHASPGGSSTAR
jgi:hypothetical protein